jgi:glycolate oxidase iron-sulfur subunit
MAEILGRLRTDQGEKTLYDAACQCSRCGYCMQACPTYAATGRETWSPRGRNQLLRSILESRLDDPRCAGEAFSTCLSCGACTTACPAKVPTSELVLEGRRLLLGRPRVLAWRLISFLLAERPDLLALMLKLAFRLHRIGLSGLSARLGLLRLLGLRPLEEAQAHLLEAPRRFLGDLLRGDPDLGDFSSARWIYFSPCGPNFLFPRVGLATIRLLRSSLGPGAWADNRCCGLFAYNYGDLAAARRLARLTIERFEQLGATPVVADCSSCAAYMKSYPGLFAADPAWRERAERFSARVRDAVEIPPPPAPCRSPSAAACHDSCRARHGQGLWKQTRAAVDARAERVEIDDSDACCGGAGLFAFKHPELSRDILLRKVGALAAAQARVAVVSASSCLLQLARGLKYYYPDCKVLHWSEAVSTPPDGADG